MKREILFRAQIVDNEEWIYGYYYPMFDDDSEAFVLSNKDGVVYQVIPETVCQFTGLTDKNETKVFENDKINVHENVCGYFKDWTARVDFRGGCFCLVDENDYPICSLCETCGEYEVI